MFLLSYSVFVFIFPYFFRFFAVRKIKLLIFEVPSFTDSKAMIGAKI